MTTEEWNDIFPIIPTAEEFLNRGLYNSGFELSGAQLKIITRNAKEFAKLHVTAALKAASEYNLNCNCDSWESCHNKIKMTLWIVTP